MVTPVGRFSRQWLAERLEQGALRELSERMFLWNEPGHDARFHRNCAPEAAVGGLLFRAL